MDEDWKQQVKLRVAENLKKLERAKTVVFWDMDGCKIPHGVSCIEVSQKIRSALAEMKYKGKEATIYAYGQKIWGSTTEIIKPREKTDDKIGVVDLDYHGTSLIYADQNQVDLQSPSIVFNHTPAEGGKVGRLSQLLAGIFFWALDHPGRANVMLILGDLAEPVATHNQFFSGIIHLKNNMYNVILVQPENVSVGDQLVLTVGEKLIWENISSCISQTDSSAQPVDNSSVLRGEKRKTPEMPQS